MFRINITSKVHGSPYLIVETQEEVDAYLAQIEESCHWGKPEQIIVHEDETVEIIPAEYTVEVIPDYVDQEKVNAEARAYLAETDYMVIRAMEDPSKPVPEEVKQARQLAREKVK